MTAILKPTHWSNQAAELLKQASGPMPTFSVSELEKAVNEGASSLFAGVSDGVIIGYIVVFVEGEIGSRDLVIQAGAAFQKRERALAAVMPAIRQMAIHNECDHIRTHISEKWTQSLYKKLGFSKREIVYHQKVM